MPQPTTAPDEPAAATEGIQNTVYTGTVFVMELHADTAATMQQKKAWHEITTRSAAMHT